MRWWGRLEASGSAWETVDLAPVHESAMPLQSRLRRACLPVPLRMPRVIKIQSLEVEVMSRRVLATLVIAAAAALSGCGYNDFQRLDESVKSSWSEVLNQYQRRADLIPNIVATVKGEANFEQETLTKVIEARAKATAIQVTPETLNNPEAFDKFQKAQGELSGALSRLLVVSEQYPSLKANQAFQDLRVQLEGTENRITVARNRYIKTVQDYNVLVRQVPTNLTAMIFKYDVKPNFTVANEAAISAPPTVSFDKPAGK
jgi:LemA protein